MTTGGPTSAQRSRILSERQVSVDGSSRRGFTPFNTHAGKAAAQSALTPLWRCKLASSTGLCTCFTTHTRDARQKFCPQVLEAVGFEKLHFMVKGNLAADQTAGRSCILQGFARAQEQTPLT